MDVFQLHNKDGSVHLHGPRDNRCPGSHKAPIGSQAPASSQPSSSDQIVTATSQPTSTPIIVSGSGPTVDITRLAHPNLTGGTIKHIPKTARAACAVYLIDLLNRIIRDPDDVVSWKSLLTMGEDILLVPNRTGKRHNLATIIRKRLDGDLGHDRGKHGNAKFLKRHTLDESLGSLVTSKIEDGNLRAAVRIL